MGCYILTRIRLSIEKFPALCNLLEEKLHKANRIQKRKFKYIDLRIYEVSDEADGFYYFTGFDPTAVTSLQWLQENLEGKALVEYAILRMRGFKTE
jgi:hypothetical protein